MDMDMDITKDPRLAVPMEQHPYPLLFATISGAHLYGFESPNSDVDLRGVHVLPMDEVLGLTCNHETVEKSGIHDGLELDLVTHDVRKFMGLMLKRNGYVLEQLLSRLVVKTSPFHDELIALAPGCLTRHHAHHYLGFAQTQWRLFSKEAPPRIKPLLYVFRVLLTGIHLMETGVVEANLSTLLESYDLPVVADWIQRKRAGNEKDTIEDADMASIERLYQTWLTRLESEYHRTKLPSESTASSQLNDLLVKIRKSVC
jgi:predicted nucleotidyltransferase